MNPKVTVSFECDDIISQELITTYSILCCGDFGKIMLDKVKYIAVLGRYLEFLPEVVAATIEEGIELPEIYHEVSEVVAKLFEEEEANRPPPPKKTRQIPGLVQ